ncbi:kinase-like domain-containing protein [Cyathus striatus]|nr:kinase-like domain-containing protein [Cyathus striatus]
MEIAVKWMSPDEDEEMDYVLKVVENEMRISTAVNALPGMAKLITGQDNYQVMIVATRRLHQLGIIHRDLKPSNIFIGPDNHIRIGDFGIAHMFDPPTEEFLSRPDWSNWVNAYRNHLECMKRGEGLSNDFPSLWADLRTPWVTRETWCTPIFSAPEVMRPEPYSFGIDFYSIGVIAHLFLTGDYPFDDPVSDESTGKRVMNFSPLLLPEEKDFITGMLRPEQMERFGYKEMLDHEMFREIDWDAIESGSVVGISGDWETEMEVRYERYKELYETVKKLSQEDAAEDVTTT